MGRLRDGAMERGSESLPTLPNLPTGQAAGGSADFNLRLSANNSA